MGKSTSIQAETVLSPDKHKTSRMIFLLIIAVFTFLLYGNTLNNTYSLDDYIIQGESAKLMKNGIQSIGEIFTTTYTSGSTAEGEAKSYGYRPIVRTVFALEYSTLKLFGIDPLQNQIAAAKAGHLVNILLYLALALILYRLLRRFFRDYSIWFPFVIVLLFIAHPVHTEVVASLKNRDELLSMIFSLLTLHMLLKYHDKDKIVYLVGGLLLYVLAFLSKPTALSFWMVFPLVFYFFTDMKLKKIFMITGLITIMIILGGMVPFFFLERARDFSMIENPLYFEDNIWYILGTGMYSLGYYFKILLIPHPLLYYYGFDMVPVVNLGNIWVLLSILGYAGILAIAIWKFKEKHVISFAILFYLLTIAMFSNIVQPAPGIIAERFLLAPSLGFVIVLAWLIFKLFKANPEASENTNARIFFVMILTAIILIPYSYKTIQRNKRWYSDLSLYKADMKYLDNSVKAHDLLGTAIMKKTEVELSKQVNVAKFLMPDIEKSINHFKRAVEIWPGHLSSWKNLGMIYNNPRVADHFVASGDTVRFVAYKKNAISSFKKALELAPTDGKALFNLGLTYENVGMYDSATYFYQICVDNDDNIINPRSRLADLRFMQGDEQEAVRLNVEITRIDPNEALPYVSFGNYYMIKGDTLKAVESYEEAAKRNSRPEVYAFLSQYYLDSGNMEKAQYYREEYTKAIQP